MTDPKTCPICGHSFTPPPTHPEQQTCSKDCGYIYRENLKRDRARKRADAVLNELLELDILDALEGRLGSGTDNRMTVKGARTWEGKRFIVLVVDEKKKEVSSRKEFYTVDEVIQGKRP